MDNISLAYRGSVKVGKYKKGRLKKIKYLKNTGTSRLFYVLCNCLMGTYYKEWGPTYLDLIFINGNNISSILNSQPRLSSAVLSNNQNIPTSSSISTTSCSITYQATLTNAYLGNTMSSSGDLYFALRDDTSEIAGERNVLAYVKTEDWSTGWSIAPDEVYIITWRLTIENSLETSENVLNNNVLNVNNNTKTITTKTRKVIKNA